MVQCKFRGECVCVCVFSRLVILKENASLVYVVPNFFILTPV